MISQLSWSTLTELIRIPSDMPYKNHWAIARGTMRSILLSRRRREALRRRFRPKRLRILFIGESAPASGRFFYRGDSGLYRAVRDVFQAADPAISDEDFLCTFQKCGCYLIDLCADPVDKLDPKARRASCFSGEALLSQRIRRLGPELIVSLVRSIRGNIDRAAAKAGWRGPVLDVPYPGRWIRHRRIFTATLLPYAKSVLEDEKLKLV